MNIAKIDPAVVEALRKCGHEETEIEKMTPEFAFNEYCEWHGLIRWGDTLIRTLDSLRASAA
jgi:hypothetical protein